MPVSLLPTDVHPPKAQGHFKPWHKALLAALAITGLVISHNVQAQGYSLNDCNRLDQQQRYREEADCTLPYAQQGNASAQYNLGTKRKEHQHRQGIAWQIALRPGQRRVMDPASPQARAEKRKASIRAKVEHPFRMFVAVLGKQVFGSAKVRYRGLHKNTNRLHLLAAFTNLLIGERYALT